MQKKKKILKVLIEQHILKIGSDFRGRYWEGNTVSDDCQGQCTTKTYIFMNKSVPCRFRKVESIRIAFKLHQNVKVFRQYSTAEVSLQHNWSFINKNVPLNSSKIKIKRLYNHIFL